MKISKLYAAKARGNVSAAKIGQYADWSNIPELEVIDLVICKNQTGPTMFQVGTLKICLSEEDSTNDLLNSSSNLCFAENFQNLQIHVSPS